MERVLAATKVAQALEESKQDKPLDQALAGNGMLPFSSVAF